MKGRWYLVVDLPLRETNHRHINFQVTGAGIVPHWVNFCWANCQSLVVARPAIDAVGRIPGDAGDFFACLETGAMIARLRQETSMNEFAL